MRDRSFPRAHPSPISDASDRVPQESTEATEAPEAPASETDKSDKTDKKDDADALAVATSESVNIVTPLKQTKDAKVDMAVEGSKNDISGADSSKDDSAPNSGDKRKAEEELEHKRSSEC